MALRVRCGEYGCSEAERWSDRFVPSSEDRDRLANLVSEGLIDIEFAGAERVRIAGKDHCGRLRLPSGAHIDVVSKVPSLKVLEWLAFTKNIPTLDEWTDDPSIGPGSTVVDALIGLFIAELVRLTQFHWRSGYAVVSQRSGTFRGRLETRRLAAVAARLPLLPCRFRERTMDTLANRVLARALDGARRMASADSLSEMRRHQLEWLTLQWSGISRSLPDLDQALLQTVGSPPVGYRCALRLSRLLLRGGVVDPVLGDGGDVFVVNMSVATGERGYQIHRRHRYPGTHPVARGRFFALTVLRRHAHELKFAERTEQSRA